MSWHSPGCRVQCVRVHPVSKRGYFEEQVRTQVHTSVCVCVCVCGTAWVNTEQASVGKADGHCPDSSRQDIFSWIFIRGHAKQIFNPISQCTS
eukprot:638265-Amphidinium_carterae.1